MKIYDLYGFVANRTVYDLRIKTDIQHVERLFPIRVNDIYTYGLPSRAIKIQVPYIRHWWREQSSLIIHFIAYTLVCTWH